MATTTIWVQPINNGYTFSDLSQGIIISGLHAVRVEPTDYIKNALQFGGLREVSEAEAIRINDDLAKLVRDFNEVITTRTAAIDAYNAAANSGEDPEDDKECKSRLMANNKALLIDMAVAIKPDEELAIKRMNKEELVQFLMSRGYCDATHFCGVPVNAAHKAIMDLSSGDLLNAADTWADNLTDNDKPEDGARVRTALNTWEAEGQPLVKPSYCALIYQLWDTGYTVE